MIPAVPLRVAELADRRVFDLLGSPHAVVILMAAMLLVLARTGRREQDAAREKWLAWAFGAVLLREVLMVGLAVLRRIAGPSSGPEMGLPWGPPFRPDPLLGIWSEHLVTAVLAAALLRYFSGRESPPRIYLGMTTGLITVAALGGGGFFARSPAPWPLAISFAGLVSMVAAFALAARQVPVGRRFVTLCALGVFIVRDLLQFGSQLLPFRPGPPPSAPIVGILTVAGLMLCGYLFIRQRSAAMHTDVEHLEGLVAERTQEVRAAMEKLREANSLLLEQSTVDGLTGVRNRRGFDKMLSDEWARARRAGAELAVALIDIDRFKEINDRHGHQAGDECLTLVAAALRDGARRTGDLVARYGGDEFALLLPGASRRNAVQLLEGIRERIADQRGIPSAPDLSFTVSIGVASACAIGGGAAPDLVRRADEELYRAKHHGRNRVGRGFPSALETAG